MSNYYRSLKPPEIRLHEPAVDFIDNHLGEYHCCLANVPSHFDPRVNKYVGNFPQPIPISKSANGTETLPWDSQFSKALVLFRKTEEPKFPSGKRFGCRSVDKSWKQVLQEVHDARSEYMATENSASKIRGVFRKIGDHGSAIKPYLAFIPNGNYTSLLSGAGNMIIDAAVRTSKIRDDLSVLSEEIKSKLKDIEDYLMIHSTEERLEHVVLELYVAILVVLEDSVRYYSERVVHHLTSIFSGEEYEKKLESKIKEIERLANELANQAHIGHQRATKKQFELQSEKLDHVAQTAVNTQNSVLELLRESIKGAEWNQEILQAVIQLSSRASSPQTCITHLHLIRVIYSDGPGYAIFNLEEAAHSGRGFKMAEQDRAAWLMQSPRFQTWLKSRSSAVLLVNGNHYPDKVSPMSYLCALLAQNLETLASRQTIVLTFFCGAHTDSYDSNDPLSNAKGLLRSLITQFINNTGRLLDLSFLTPECIEFLQSQCNLSDLENLFWHLANQLTASYALFIIIDGISFFETDDRLPDMLKVLGLLVDLAVGGHRCTNTCIKVLITTPTKSSVEVKELFQEEEMLRLPPQVPRSGLGFADKQMNRQSISTTARRNGDEQQEEYGYTRPRSAGRWRDIDRPNISYYEEQW